MKFRYKNDELREFLDKISLGKFSEELEELESTDDSDSNVVRFDATDGTSFEITLPLGSFVQVYDPTEWNEYPEIKPPEGVLMRAETDCEDLSRRRRCIYFKEGQWFWEDGCKSVAKVFRYRPWDDPDEE